MKKIVLRAMVMIVLPGCNYNLVSSPHTVIRYDQVGETCVYTEEFGEHILRVSPHKAESAFYVRLNKREVHFASTACRRIIEEGMTYSNNLHKMSLYSAALEQESVLNRNLELLQ